MKWVFFFLSLLALLFANNALFWSPVRYNWFTFFAAGVAITLAIVFAWLSGPEVCYLGTAVPGNMEV